MGVPVALYNQETRKSKCIYLVVRFSKMTFSIGALRFKLASVGYSSNSPICLTFLSKDILSNKPKKVMLETGANEIF